MKKFFLIFALLSQLSFAASPSRLLFNDSLISDVLRMGFSEILHEPYVIHTDVLSKKDLVTLDLRGATPAAVRSNLLQMAKQNSIKADKIEGVWHFAMVKVEEDVVDVIYHPKYREPSHFVSLLGSMFKNTQVGSDKAAQGGKSEDSARTTAGASDFVVFTGTKVQAARFADIVKKIDQPVGQVEVRAVVYQFQNDKRDAGAVKVVGEIFGSSLSVGAAVIGNALTLKVKGLDVVLSGLATDSRFKIVSRPQVRIRDGGQGVFTVGDETPVLGAVTSDKAGNPQQSIEYKPSGTILTVKPVVRDTVVDLDISQELSTFTKTNTGVSQSPTLLKRSVKSSVSVVPGEVIVLGGLVDRTTREEASLLPFLRWPFSKSEDSVENEVLMLLQVERVMQL